MSIEEHRQNISDIKEGMALAEYNMLREKALRGEMLFVTDENGNIVEVPAADRLLELYGETLPDNANPALS